MRATVGRLATIGHITMIGGVDADKLLRDIQHEVQIQTMKETELKGEMGKPNSDEELIGGMRRIIEDLHKGISLEEARKRFSELTKDVTAEQIAKMEERLMKVCRCRRCNVCVMFMSAFLKKLLINTWSWMSSKASRTYLSH